MLSDFGYAAAIVLFLIFVGAVGVALWDKDKQETAAKHPAGLETRPEVPEVSLPAATFYSLLDDLDRERSQRRKIQDALDALINRDPQRFTLGERHLMAMARLDETSGAAHEQ